MTKNVNRLYAGFQPENYKVTLHPSADKKSFRGSVVVLGKKVGRPSQRITLHQKDLKITSAKAKKLGKDPSDIKFDRINTHGSYDEVRLHSKTMIYPGQYEITLEFSGKITDTMHGIYPCNFIHDGKKKQLLATQFESHHAREAFPCIDEPEAKATFDLSLITPKGEKVLSNTPVKSQTTTGNRTTTTFEQTPKMSSYLLAFVVGEIHGVEGQTQNGIAVNSWATIAQPKSHLKYANQEAIKTLEFFEDYFKTPFPLPKVDQVALPDFESLAMENWGLITFREVGLLADPTNRSISSEQLISLVIAHELSHQWFGNLVTMKWWDDLWLNESFASLMEHLALDALHPDWHEWENFTSSRVISASDRDVYKDVQAVGVKVNHPDEIMTLFDPSIVYAKGARLLKMLLDYIGEEAFRKGLRIYFKKHAYSNTTRDDLWAALSEVTGKEIGKLMTPWIEQSGTPMLSVKTDGQDLVLSQKRFLLDGQDEKSLWPIPLLTDQPTKPDILNKRSTPITTSGKTPVFNINGSGHFITNYQSQNARDALTDKIIKRSVDSSARIIALNDMLRLSQKGEISLVEILQIVSNCNQEDRDAVWSMLSRAIGFASTLIDGDESAEDNLRAYKRGLINYWYKKLGWQDGAKDDPNTKHLRTTALALSVTGRHPDAVKHALDKFDKAKSSEELPAEQRAMIIGAAVRRGKSSDIKKLMAEYQTSQSSEVKDSIAAGLCSTHDPKVAKQIITWGMDAGGVVRDQDIDHFFAYLMRNHHTRDLAWQWLVDNWARLAKIFGNGKRMEFFIWYAARPISTKQWQVKFEKLFKPKIKQVALERNIKIALSEIEARVAWRSREEAKLKKFLKTLK